MSASCRNCAKPLGPGASADGQCPSCSMMSNKHFCRACGTQMSGPSQTGMCTGCGTCRNCSAVMPEASPNGMCPSCTAISASRSPEAMDAARGASYEQRPHQDLQQPAPQQSPQLAAPRPEVPPRAGRPVRDPRAAAASAGGAARARRNSSPTDDSSAGARRDPHAVVGPHDQDDQDDLQPARRAGGGRALPGKLGKTGGPAAAGKAGGKPGAGKNGPGKGQGGGGKPLDKAADAGKQAADKAAQAALASAGVGGPLGKLGGKVAGKAAEVGIKKAPQAAAAGVALLLVPLIVLITILGGNAMGDLAPEDPGSKVADQMPGGADGDWAKALLAAQESTRDRGDLMVPWTVLAGIAKVNTDFGKADPYLVPVVEAPPAGDPGAPAPAPAPGGSKPTIVLDPGHSGRGVSGIDAATGLQDNDYPNTPEMAEVWQVSVKVREQLTAAGYNVIMTKSSANDSVSLRGRATIASGAKAALAMSIHNDHGRSFASMGEIYTQKVGLYRVTPAGKKITFTNAAVAAKSTAYANIFAAERGAAEGRAVTIKDNSFNGRPGLAPGNIPLVQLFATDVPWLYHEVGAPAGRGATPDQINRYVTGLVNGVKKAVPIAAAPAAATPAPGVSSTSGLQVGVNAAGDCPVKVLDPKIGGGADQAHGAFLLRPDVANTLTEQGKDPQNVCDSANLIAQRLAEVAKDKRGQEDFPNFNPNKQEELGKFWAAVIAESRLVTDTTGQVGDCRLPGGAANVPVDYEIGWVWRCQLGQARQLHVAGDARMENGKVVFDELGREEAVSRLVSEAQSVAFTFSKLGAAKCEPNAALAGVFPLSKSVASTYGAANRCDRSANILAAAQAVTAIETQPFARRNVGVDGPYAPMLGGWSTMPEALSGDRAAFAKKGPYRPWEPTEPCQAKMDTYVRTLLASPGNPFAKLAGSDVPETMPAEVTAAAAAAGAAPVADGACAGAREDPTSFYGSLAARADQVQVSDAPAPAPSTPALPSAADSMTAPLIPGAPNATAAPLTGAALNAARTGLAVYFADQAAHNHPPKPAFNVHSAVPRLSPIAMEVPDVPLSDFEQPTGALPGTKNMIEWAAWFGGFGFGSHAPGGPPPANPAAVSAAGGFGDGTAIKPGAVPAQYVALLEQGVKEFCPQLPIGILAGQIQSESNWNPRATSPVGAQGIAQFMPGTWASSGVDANKDGKKDVWDPADAIPSAAKYNCQNFKQVKGIPGDPVKNMLAAYNAGPGAVKKYGGVPPYPETQNYVAKITKLATELTISVTVPGTVSAGGCPTSAPANTLRNGSANLTIARLCANSVAKASSPQAAAAIKTALSGTFIGKPYSQARRNATGWYDCSSYVSRAYLAAGVNLYEKRYGSNAPVTWTLLKHPKVKRIPYSQALPGDLVFPGDYHVGILLSDGYMVHTNQDGDVAHVQRDYGSGTWATLRVIP